ncbi:signal peptidase I [Cohnella faecalis]|uniref:Signal peptidase I n=1 Tax=Cohnella faecalis TaxID=2315694 RepID=A0A398CTL3_9BACL|nr:signal peptidase I [Cohnella faecalis]RIE02304.1 signal peptidase I [Cohnella faecalis]
MNKEAESLPTPVNRRTRSAAPKRELSGWRKELWDWLRALLIAAALVAVIQTFVFQLSTVKMHSMQPTLFEKEWLFVNKISYELGHPKRGDIVILKDPSIGDGRKKYLVKRVIGIPGDTLEVRNEQLYVNGELQIEPYTDSPIEDGDFGPLTVGAGHYFVMGDNRHLGQSKDSRMFKEVPEKLIQGRAEAVVWPIVRWSKL